MQGEDSQVKNCEIGGQLQWRERTLLKMLIACLQMCSKIKKELVTCSLNEKQCLFLLLSLAIAISIGSANHLATLAFASCFESFH